MKTKSTNWEKDKADEALKDAKKLEEARLASGTHVWFRINAKTEVLRAVKDLPEGYLKK